MNILYLRTVFWFGLKSGGSVGHTAGVINALVKLAKVHIVSNDHLPGVFAPMELIRPGLLRYIPVRFGELLYNMLIIKKIKEKTQSYDYIYQRYSGLSFAGAFLSRKYGVPLILEFNSSEVWAIKNWSGQTSAVKSMLVKLANVFRLPVITRLEAYNLAKASLIVVVSETLKENLLARGISAQKILVNPNGVDPGSYSPKAEGTAVKEQYGLYGMKVVGFIGTFGDWHGVIELAQAIKHFFRHYPAAGEKTMFLLIGDGKLRSEVKKIIHEAGYADRVIFAGLIPQKEGPRYLAACDILLSPHKKNPDGSKFFGSPTKLFEYMAMEKPIIASDLDQIGDILTHGETAFLVEPGNIPQLASAIDNLLHNPELGETISKGARSTALEKYTWTKHVERLLMVMKYRRGISLCTS